MENILVAEGIRQSFPLASGLYDTSQEKEFVALHDISVQIPAGKLTILRGRSGSGKTTLMNILSALDYPKKGSVVFEGQNLEKMSETEREVFRKTNVGFVFQSVALIPMMTAYENVEFLLRLANYGGSKKKRAEECLKLVGLGQRMHHMPQELSGGEQQRVAIARAIAHKPKIIFVEIKNRRQIQSPTQSFPNARYKKQNPLRGWRGWPVQACGVMCAAGAAVVGAVRR